MQAGTDKGGHTGPTARQDPSLPQVFGRYLLVQRLSRGGMGEIFLAKHGLAGFEKLAVIKKVLPHLAADAQFISRFVDEAQVAIKLQHVNVAQVFEVGRVGDEYFLALEYVEGRDLRRTLALLAHRRTRLPVDLALFIGRELANGLAYAHRRTSQDGSSLNLVHCDISPPNVLVSFEGETKVIDFGIAKSALRGTATDPKMGFGKFGYMAPEQLIRGGLVDHRTDIYAAGVVLYELLTGMRLYEAGPEPDYRALAKKVAKGDHPMPGECDRSLALYDDLVATALRPRSEDRYQSAAEFRDAIQQALVNVNPTISTDQLGSYMRDLFSEEMTGQKELHDRVAKTHLADFQEQMHTATISTVSFAMAQLPLQAPPEAPRARPVPLGRTTGQSKALPAASIPAASMDDLALADGTGTSVREQPPEKSRKVLVLGVFASLAVIAVVAVAMTRGKGETEKVAVADPAAGSAKKITFEPIEPPQTLASPPPAKKEPAVAQVETREGDVKDPPPVKVVTKKKDPPRRVTDPLKKEPPKTTTTTLTREAVGAKFSATSRQYEAYKAKNGMQLDREWNELTSYIQYKMNADTLDDAVRRIDAFRAKLRE
ncbi:MAG: protein kinase [Deltaproteobacteria bacterium]|nr:protein kinase [Deltaproteobacteria bacterium]